MTFTTLIGLYAKFHLNSFMPGQAPNDNVEKFPARSQNDALFKSNGQQEKSEEKKKFERSKLILK